MIVLLRLKTNLETVYETHVKIYLIIQQLTCVIRSVLSYANTHQMISEKT